MKGSYVLVMKLDKDSKIRVGRLGPTVFRKGYYCYVGSALNNLEKRVGRHMAKNKRKKWHIDYFIDKSRVMGVSLFPNGKRMECDLGRFLEYLSEGIVKGFGCSDCKCKSHLYFFKSNPLNILNEQEKTH